MLGKKSKLHQISVFRRIFFPKMTNRGVNSILQSNNIGVVNVSERHSLDLIQILITLRKVFLMKNTVIICVGNMSLKIFVCHYL